MKKRHRWRHRRRISVALPKGRAIKKMEEEKKTDRISTLPDSILHHILSYLLNDHKSRVRMSVLSKKWLALTASFPFFYFHLNGDWYDYFPTEDFNNDWVDMFWRYVEYTVSRFCDHNLSAHTLDIFAQFLYLEHIELFGRCLELVIEKGLQVLVIDVVYWDRNHLPKFRLPNTLLSASSLTSLAVKNCELPSPLIDGVVELKSLRLLTLTDLPIDEGVIEYLTKGCPLLDKMFLRYCYGFRTFCVKRHQNLRKVAIYCEEHNILDRIDVDAPNLSVFFLNINTDKAPSMSLGSCKKLTTFCYRGLPLKKFNDLLSNFPFVEYVKLDLLSHVDNLKLSHHFLKRLELKSDCNLDEIDINAPNLLLFKYDQNSTLSGGFRMPRKDSSSLAKGCMKCHTGRDFDILWFQKLRRFLEKNSIFKVLKIYLGMCIDVEELKLTESPPYELAHVKLEHGGFRMESPVYIALVDALLWCFQPQSLTLEVDRFTDKGDVIKYTYEKLLQQEDESQTNIKFVLKSSSKDKQHFSDLNSLLKALSLDEFTSKITFIKEESCPRSRIIMEHGNRDIL